MRLRRIQVALIFLISFSAWGFDGPPDPAAYRSEAKKMKYSDPGDERKAAPQFAALGIQYQVDCDPTKEGKPIFPGITGEIAFQNRVIRFELYDAEFSTIVGLGMTADPIKDLEISLDASADCRLTKISFRREYEDLAKLPEVIQTTLLHTPFLASRDDQIDNRFTDLPLGVGHSRMKVDGRQQKYTIRFTTFFADEDTMTSVAAANGQKARYGRASDIEWDYEIEFDDGTVRKSRERYQCPLFGGVGHTVCDFKGEYLPDSEQPIIYNYSRNNNFHDQPTERQKPKLIGHHYLPPRAGGDLQPPLPREVFMFWHPWTFRATDFELIREKKFSQPFTDYLYVLIDGNYKTKGNFVGRLVLDSGEEILSGGGSGDIDRLGEDLWDRESYTAIPLNTRQFPQRLLELGKPNLDKNFHGTFTFKTTRGSPDLKISKVAFYRFRVSQSDRRGISYWPEEITPLFKLQGNEDGLRTEWKF